MKAIYVTEKLHEQLKREALRRKISMIQLVAEKLGGKA
jgi:predicted HicB family RNase H-like nuclease